MSKETLKIVPIPGADKGFYITPDGMVLREVPKHMRGQYKWANIHRNGKQKSFAVHRMVAAAFIPNPDNKPQVNHINGDKLDNRVENLEWVTPGENTRHAHALGLVKTRRQPVVMFDMDGRPLQTFRSQKDAAAFLGVSYTGNISQCVCGKQRTAHGYIWKARK